MTAFTGEIDGGAVLVPDSYRKALGLDDGDALSMEVHGEELRIRPGLSAADRVQERSKRLQGPDRSLVDELVADRRAEAAREDRRLGRPVQHVLDASAVLRAILLEPGSRQVEESPRVPRSRPSTRAVAARLSSRLQL